MSVNKTYEIKHLSKLYNKKLDDNVIATYVEMISKFSDESVRIACKKIIKEDIRKYMPLPVEVLKKTAKIEEWLRTKRLSTEILRCEYRNLSESDASKRLCEKVDVGSAEASRLNGWGALCRWHYDVKYCEYWEGKHPGHEVTRRRFVDDMLKASEHQKSLDEEKIVKSIQNSVKIMPKNEIRASF